MAPLAGVRVGGRLSFSREEAVETFHDVFGHPHELIICGGWRHALCHRVVNGLYGIEETEWECYCGAPEEVFRGEGLSPSKLCHDIGEREGEVVQVLPGWSGS